MLRWIGIGAGAAAVYAVTYCVYEMWTDKDEKCSKLKNGQESAVFSAELRNNFPEEAIVLYSTLHQVGIDELRLHSNVQDRFHCNYCHNNDFIRGVRYVCAQCDSENICEACERENVHDKSHLLYKINYNVPFELNRYIARGQLPWQSQANLSFLAFHPDPVNLSFEQIKAVKDMLTHDSSTSDIEALYEQFRRLADTPLDLPDFAGLGAISFPAMSRLLSTRYCTDTQLPEFALTIYDSDNDGTVSFPDYVKGHDLIINASNERRVGHFIEYLKAKNEPKDDTGSNTSVETRLRRNLMELLFSYNDLSKHAFADAVGLLLFDREKIMNESETREAEKRLGRNLRDLLFINNKKDGRAMALGQHGSDPAAALRDSEKAAWKNETRHGQTAIDAHLESLLLEERTEIDSLATYNDIGRDPVIEMEMATLWDLSVDEFIGDILDGASISDGDIWSRLSQTLCSSPKFLGMVNALFEAGII